MRPKPPSVCTPPVRDHPAARHTAALRVLSDACGIPLTLRRWSAVPRWGGVGGGGGLERVRWLLCTAAALAASPV
ncbi:hypothetical protein GCM10020229_10170 [Kitasatospora albolonga]